MKWLRATHEEIQKRFRTEYARGLKIVVLHHHLLPVGDEGYFGEAFMSLANSAEVLGLLAEMKVDLVLHGHKHVPAVRLLDMANFDHRLIILSAGTATSHLEGGGKSEEKAEIMSTQCSFFSVEIDPDKIGVTEYRYANTLQLPEKFLRAQNHTFKRSVPEFSKLEIEIIWTITFPQGDWDVQETHTIQRTVGSVETQYLFDAGCTVPADPAQIGFAVQRTLNNLPAGADVSSIASSPKTLPGAKDWTYFKAVVGLSPGLALGNNEDRLQFTYRWPGGFEDFGASNTLDGTWSYASDVSKLRLIVRLQGQPAHKLTALWMVVPRQKEPVCGVLEPGGGLLCEITDLRSSSQITYVMQRD